MMLDDHQLDRLNGSCRECTLPRSDRSSQAQEWIHGNTKIGPVLDVMICNHEGRYGVEGRIESLFGDKSCSSVRIVNEILKYFSEGTRARLQISTGIMSGRRVLTSCVWRELSTEKEQTVQLQRSGDWRRGPQSGKSREIKLGNGEKIVDFVVVSSTALSKKEFMQSDTAREKGKNDWTDLGQV